ncbi:MAG: protoporphyrinogen oxidase, partial [Armatimonadota bacterium]
SLVLAALARQRTARETSGTKESGTQRSGTPGPSPMFLSLIGGLGELVERLEASLTHTTILTASTVRRIAQRFHRGRILFAVELDDGRSLVADALLLAVPARVSARLLAPLAPLVADRLRAIPYVSTAAVTLAYQRDAIRHPLDGHGFVVARSEPLGITACTWVSSKWPHRAPPDIALIRCYLGAAGREAIVGEDDALLIERSRADLRATMGIEAMPVFTTVTRWTKAMPQYLPGHLDRLEAIESGLRALPNLALAGAGYRGVGIPDCIRQGTETATRLIETLAVSGSGQIPIRAPGRP